MSDGNPFSDVAGVEQTDNQTDNKPMFELERDIDGSTEAADITPETDPLASTGRFMADMRELDNVKRVAQLAPEVVMVEVERDEPEAVQGATHIVESDGWYCTSYRGHEEGHVATFTPVPVDAHEESADRGVVRARLDASDQFYQAGVCGPGVTAIGYALESGEYATFSEWMDAFGWYVAQIDYDESGLTCVFMPFEGYGDGPRENPDNDNTDNDHDVDGTVPQHRHWATEAERQLERMEDNDE